MASVKRRRNFNINVNTIAALSKRAKLLKASPTAVATMIIQGEIPPLGSAKKRDGGTKGVSMSEALWLAVKEYVAATYPEAAYAAIADQILRGEVAPPPATFIRLGEKKAKEREEQRALDIKEERKKEAEKNPGEKTKSAKLMRKDEEYERKHMRRKLSKGEPMDTDQARPSQNLVPGENYYGGVKML